ncbi:hypothetical protein BCR36DRAFT_403397 [Piromyces finnis]|uniref:N-acetyltransferase domain-containing protein n=1 Tax=Piromyces finnis TaxID=1754191 RepID=A0A1Y1VEQ9_9FUNG|nr:hypothetical protein BCR36DRAFT_403397 [Piromyces finnis]|eukprot:ORX54335.1 hypothetical protein BCR36DRAFT_403397 [Piromyces finnis]
MQLQKVVIENKIENKRIHDLYFEAFPPNERLTYWILQRRVKQERAEQWNLYDENQWVGWVYLIKLKERDYIYIFYFAIHADFRGKGYGTKALKAILEHYKNYRIILCLEDWREDTPDKEIRIKRHNFYLKCGFQDLPYIQKEPKLSFATMRYGDSIKPKEFKEMIDTYMGWPLKYINNWNLVEIKNQ